MAEIPDLVDRAIDFRRLCLVMNRLDPQVIKMIHEASCGEGDLVPLGWFRDTRYLLKATVRTTSKLDDSMGSFAQVSWISRILWNGKLLDIKDSQLLNYAIKEQSRILWRRLAMSFESSIGQASFQLMICKLSPSILMPI